jgi:hypothetical protein
MSGMSPASSSEESSKLAVSDQDSRSHGHELDKESENEDSEPTAVSRRTNQDPVITGTEQSDSQTTGQNLLGKYESMTSLLDQITFLKEQSLLVEPTKTEFDAVEWEEPIPDKILRSAAKATLIQWGAICFNTQGRFSQAITDNLKCDCIKNLCSENPLEPPTSLINGLVDFFHMVERDKILDFRTKTNKMTSMQRHNVGLTGGAAEMGISEYNKHCKKWNSVTADEREQNGMQRSPFVVHTDLATIHWRSKIFAKKEKKKAYITICDDVDSLDTHTEDANSGSAICEQAFYSFLARLPPNQEMAKCYVRLGNFCNVFMRQGGRHLYTSRALFYAVAFWKCS